MTIIKFNVAIDPLIVGANDDGTAFIEVSPGVTIEGKPEDLLESFKQMIEHVESLVEHAKEQP